MNAKKTSLIHRPWFAFFSSMRFAVALLCVLAVASVIGTVLQQNQAQADYIVKFGPFWSRIFGFLGLFDVYASAWFVLIMLFLVISTALCLWRNIPPFMREMRSFRTGAGKQSLAAMRHSMLLAGRPLPPEAAGRYLAANGFAFKQTEREDGSILIAAKKGTAGKWGYILAHLALIVICAGGLIDSNLLLKAGMLAGRIVPDNSAQFARDFKPESTLSPSNPSFRGNVDIAEGQSADVAFLNTEKGMLVQTLPFTVKLNRFHIDFYDTGMPKDFASEVTVTRQNGEEIRQTVRVNRPLTVDGVTIYQAGFGDGGSDLQFKAWDLNSPGYASADLKAVSMRAFPLNLAADKKYTLEFDRFTPTNVEDMGGSAEKTGGIGQIVNDARAVKQEKQFTNLGPSIVYRLRDAAGQAVGFKHYMLPVKQEDGYFFITGTQSSLDQPYRWLRIPADAQGKIDTFMALREALNDAGLRRRIAEQSAAGVGAEIRPQLTVAVENTLALFARGGYLALNEFIDTRIPAAEREKMRRYFYQILFAAVSQTLDAAVDKHGLPAMPAGEARNRFLAGAAEAYTGLKEYPSPVLLQLEGFKEVRSSGLQMTKSPGAVPVYFGSLLLVLGTIFMFYVREKRAWLLFDADGVRFAMSAARSERDLLQEFPAHAAALSGGTANGANALPDAVSLSSGRLKAFSGGDWLFFALMLLTAAFAQYRVPHHMDGYETAMLWFAAAAAAALGWFFKPLRVFVPLSAAAAYCAVTLYAGHFDNHNRFLLKYFLSSQSAVMWQCALVLFALFCYLAGSLVSLKQNKNDNTLLGMGSGLAWTAAFAGFTGLLVRWHESYLLRPDAGHIPVSNLYEVFILFIVITTLMYLYYERKFSVRRLGVFVFALLAAAECFVVWYSITRGAHQIQPLIPALQSWWMKIHVPANFIGYGAFCMAAMLGTAELVALHKPRSRLPDPAVIDEIMYKAVAVGFLFFTIATILGALWAADAWGRYWSWDPKETWAFIVWLNYAVWLHLRLVAGWRGKILAWWAIIGLFITAFAFVGVNMFLSGLHSYGSL